MEKLAGMLLAFIILSGKALACGWEDHTIIPWLLTYRVGCCDNTGKSWLVVAGMEVSRNNTAYFLPIIAVSFLAFLLIRRAAYQKGKRP